MSGKHHDLFTQKNQIFAGKTLGKCEFSLENESLYFPYYQSMHVYSITLM